ncbi:MAG: hypothetical protein EZS28_042694 [Streblomastix strix]|uniref:Reverse transcriptase domain-containing protein n=1 Tax=Streblomastix strix TaxID=222440 RepID=A0A5J4TV84_9EUKA|nr:MAG: hypothetical protein EZS28_042694 [Streblomastix strix]
MPFGVATAPRIFTKTLKPAMMEVRRRWQLRILAYADDILLLNQDQQMLRQETIEIKNFLMSLGWLITEDKREDNIGEIGIIFKIVWIIAQIYPSP